MNRLVDGNPVEAAIAFAREFTLYSLPVLGFAREAVTRALDNSINEGLRIEADLSTLAYNTRDAEEGHERLQRKEKGRLRR